jgi:hypothetical protein
MSEQTESLSETYESDRSGHEQARLHEFCETIKWFPDAHDEFKENLAEILRIITLGLGTTLGIVLMIQGDKLLSVIPTTIAGKVILHYLPLDIDAILNK